jgi:hypothetical protein
MDMELPESVEKELKEKQIKHELAIDALEKLFSKAKTKDRKLEIQSVIYTLKDLFKKQQNNDRKQAYLKILNNKPKIFTDFDL